MENRRNKVLTRYFILTYLVFFILLGMTGALISAGVPPAIQQVMKNVCAWSPTIALIILFRKIYPGIHVKDYLKSNFLAGTNAGIFLMILIVQTVILISAVILYTLTRSISLSSVSFMGFRALLPAIIINFSSGPLGEELGWRAYALNEFQKKHSPFGAALIVGVIWGFWHTPLWFLTGFTGLDLIRYIVIFLIGIITLSLIITVLYNRHKNILIPIWIHFLFNFLLQLPQAELIPLLRLYIAGYIIFAAVLVYMERRTVFRKPTG